MIARALLVVVAGAAVCAAASASAGAPAPETSPGRASPAGGRASSEPASEPPEAESTLATQRLSRPLVAFRIVGDGIPEPLTRSPGDAARGRAIASDRNAGGCVLCHALPDSAERFMGNVAPSLAGVGARLSPAQIRLRVVDPTRVDPDTPMPAYYRVAGLRQVAAAYRGKPILDAQQIEDVVAYLSTLKEPAR